MLRRVAAGVALVSKKSKEARTEHPQPRMRHDTIPVRRHGRDHIRMYEVTSEQLAQIEKLALAGDPVRLSLGTFFAGISASAVGTVYTIGQSSPVKATDEILSSSNLTVGWLVWLLVAVLFGVTALVQFILWLRSRIGAADLIEQIREQPELFDHPSIEGD